MQCDAHLGKDLSGCDGRLTDLIGFEGLTQQKLTAVPTFYT